MIIGFIGDVHGLVYHAIALAATWQFQTGRQFDYLIQVGDMGAFPDLSNANSSAKRLYAIDPVHGDFSRMLQADGKRAEALARVRKKLLPPMHFLRGNNEDFDYLTALRTHDLSGFAKVDPFDLFRYVPDGTLLRLGELNVAFLGGIEVKGRLGDSEAINETALARIFALGSSTVDVLVTHDVHYGVNLGYNGGDEGSDLIKSLVERTKPNFHVAGHRHHLTGPWRSGQTTSWTLSAVVPYRRWFPELNGFDMGCLAVLDTEAGTLRPVTEDWMMAFDTQRFTFDSWFDSLGL